MRILICTWKDLSHPAAGGAEVFTEEIARAWAAQGHDVTLFCSAVAGQPADELRADVRIVRRGGRLSVYRAAKRFYRAEAGAFDVVIDEINTRPFFCGSWASQSAVLPLIFQLADDVWAHEFPAPVAWLGRVLERRWLRTYRNHPVATISESSRASLREHGLQDVHVVPVGVRSSDADVEPRESVPTVVFLGRLVSNKRPADALNAFRLLQREHPEARMWVIGTGPLERKLRTEFPSDAITFLGWLSEDEKYRRLARAHTLVVTSVREGWGLVVSEAAAAGTPSIGYDVPGLRDSVLAAGGVLVDPTPVAMAAALVEHLPRWSSGVLPEIGPGGTAPWETVAKELLRVGLDEHAPEASRT